MRHIKHDFIANYILTSAEGKRDLLMDEISKAILLYPKAIADVLDTCGIYYKSDEPKELMSAIKTNADDLRMQNRLVKIAILVNRNGSTTYDKHARTISHRNLMRKGSQFLKQHSEIIKELVLLSKESLQDKTYSKRLGKFMDIYLNMDGNEPIDYDMEQYNEDEVGEIKKTITPNQKKDESIGALILYGAFIFLLLRLATSKT